MTAHAIQYSCKYGFLFEGMSGTLDLKSWHGEEAAFRQVCLLTWAKWVMGHVSYMAMALVGRL